MIEGESYRLKVPRSELLDGPELCLPSLDESGPGQLYTAMTRHALTRWFAGIEQDKTRITEPPSPEADARVRCALDSIPAVLFEFDTGGIYTCVAGGHVGLFGLRPAQLVGRSAFEFPKLVPGKNLMVRRALAGEAVSFTIIWHRGRLRMQLTPRRDRDGKVVGVVGLGYELTEPKPDDTHLEQLLLALQQSEARFRVMCDSAPLGICVTDSQLDLRYANAALCALLGREAHDLLGRGWQSAVHPDQAMPQQAPGNADTSDLPYGGEGLLRLVREDGSTVWTSVRSAEMRDDGELMGYVVTLADITRERSARMSTEQARRDLRRVIETSPEGIAILRDSRCIFANRALVSALGYDGAEQLVGRDAREFVHAEDHASFCALCLTGLNGSREGRTHELRWRRADGSYALLDLRAAELAEFEGAAATLLSARDVTETKALQARLLVSERLSSMGSLAAGVAHEINNPLAAALLHLDWVAMQLSRLAATQQPQLAQELRAQLLALVKPVHEAREAGARVRDIVQDLKVFSRPEDETQGIVDLSCVLESAVRLAWNELRQRARLVRDWCELPKVHGNEARLGQVLLNLLINAAHAVDEGHAEEHEIRVTARASGSRCVVVEVSDTGRGIAPEIMGRIFDPFFTTKPPGIGTGLGLSICQRLVTSMGGQIEVESRVGKGSTFRVTLLAAHPLQDVTHIGNETDLSQPAAAPARGRLMIIDDDPAVASALELMLTPQHTVHVFMSARPALARLRAGTPYDMVLCDIMMPDMSGIEFHTELCESHPELARKVIFVTGGTCNANTQDFLDRVDNPRLYKPFEAATLYELVNAQLRVTTR